MMRTLRRANDRFWDFVLGAVLVAMALLVASVILGGLFMLWRTLSEVGMTDEGWTGGKHVPHGWGYLDTTLIFLVIGGLMVSFVIYIYSADGHF